MKVVEYHEEQRAIGLARPVLGSVLLDDTIYIVSDTMIWSLTNDALKNEHPQLTALARVPTMTVITLPATLYTDKTTIEDEGFFIMDDTFTIYSYAIKTRQLMSIPSAHNHTTTALVPAPRTGHASVSSVDYQHLFLYGGKPIEKNGTTTTTATTTSALDTTFWKYNLVKQQWSPLADHPSKDGRGYYGHTMSMLSNGQLVVLGGAKACGQNDELVDLANAIVYDTHSGQWHEKTLGGRVPASRMYHSEIVICGGQDNVPPPFHTYLSADQQHLEEMTALLNTKTWEWQAVIPSTNNQPLPQSMASALLIDGTKMLYGLGQSYQTIHDGLYILDSETLEWLPRGALGSSSTAWLGSGDELASSAAMLSAAVIIALCFAVIAVIVLIWLLWRLGRKAILQGISSIKHELWDPRPGEPGWTEFARLALKFTFGAYMVYLVLSLTRQIIHSPIIDQQYYDETTDGSIYVPDVRFCFDDYQQTEPYVRCATDYGMQCSQYLQTFYPPTARERVCILFRAPDTVRLASPVHRQAEGSYLKFDYYGNVTQVQISLYHRDHDPNLEIYNLKKENDGDDMFEWTSPYEESHFRAAESTTYHHYQEQQHLVTANRVHTGSYALGKRIVLKEDSWWNYIGYASDTATWHQITSSKLISESSPPTYVTGGGGGKQPLGSLHLFPERYTTQITAEQRAFTVVQAIGVLGGVFGLLVTAQHWLFGYRPRSPWGVIQRWSIGQMRLSLLQGLLSKFQQKHENVPIVHPLLKRTSSSATHVERMAHLEDRLHTLEQLFQAYYIDDEIFQSLDQAFTRPTSANNSKAPNDSLLRLRLPSFKKAKHSTSL
ncbi:hypothetical protein BDB00DRAFT_878606 [Zychaea mexicana]|uniref:uncharacterized protein n=1 Tax=Zychaea mexicana TaxID=64656 RepID=UPI0022FEB268|nr:uncharacterized protein BDB00DRAFT_878606 [Zychaea mexicana]KAI9484637.1 hypothetical protein BDB00DRAFT_878606 [Zychaea mexicana]